MKKSAYGRFGKYSGALTGKEADVIFPEVSIEEWTKKFPGLTPEPSECSCGTKGMTTRPVICKDWVGLAMPACGRCGDEIPGLVVISRNPKIQAEMNALLGV